MSPSLRLVASPSMFSSTWDTTRPFSQVPNFNPDKSDYENIYVLDYQSGTVNFVS